MAGVTVLAEINGQVTYIGGKINVAAALHEGFAIKVTEKVRAAVFAQVRKRMKRRKLKLGIPSDGATKVWVIKGRPFVKVPFEEAQDRIMADLGNGLTLTFKKF